MLPRPAHFALSALLLWGCNALAQERPQQREHRADFQTAANEVFDVVEQFYDYDPSLPVAPRTVESWEDEGIRYEKVVFTTQNGDRVPGALALPLDQTGAVPVVLLLHGLGNSKERWTRPDRVPLRDSLLASGIGVFAFDLRLHGERSFENDYQNPVYLTFGDSLYIRNRDMIIGSTIDARRALDYLSTRPEIDPDRMAVAGYSLGGLIALYLSALEPRLVTIVGCAVPTTTSPLPTDAFQFASRATVPAALLIGETDWLSSPADARTLHGLLPEESTLVFFDAGHSLPPEFAVDAASWLVDRLR
ncbi:MAG: hypothetical protein Rubg2KO_35870 [Rubricoccaceae bacterium]